MKIIIKILHIALLAGCFINIALSLDPKKQLKQYIHETWNTGNGLPQNSVSSIVQSEDGYLWFATQEGVARFDGSRFTIFDRINTPELGTSNISAIRESSDGSMWFFGNNGSDISQFKNGKFIQVSRLNGFPDVQINNSTLDSSGALWLTTIKGIKKFDGSQFQLYTKKDGLPNDTCTFIHVGHNKRLWIGSFSPGLTLYENGKFTVYGKEQGFSGKFIYAMREDHAGNLWYATEQGLGKFSNSTFTQYPSKDSVLINSLFFDSKNRLYLSTVNGLERFEDGAFIKIPNKDGSARVSIGRIYEDKKQTLWVAPFGKGLQRLRDGALESFTAADGLSANDVRAIFEDKEGSIWIGTYGGGLDRLRDSKFTTLGPDEGLSDNLIQTIFEDRDSSLWIGTFINGLNHFKDGKNTIYTMKDNLGSNAIQAIAQDKSGAIWVATTDGLCKYNNGTFTRYTTKDSLPSNTAQALLVDKNGALWAGLFGGIVKYLEGKFTVVHRDNNNTFVTLFECADGSIMAGTTNGYGIIRNGTYQSNSLPESLKGSQIYSIHQDEQGTLWMGAAGNGILRIKAGKTSLVSPRDGLFDFNAYCMLEDDFGNLWTDCNKGIYRVSIRELNDFCDGKIPSVKCVVYGTADGMKNVECNGGTSPNAWKLHDGRLAFSTVKGVAIINPADITLNMVPPAVVIEQMLVDNKNFSPKENNSFPPGTEKFEFSFAGISFLGGEKVKYKYKLEPFEKDWVEAGTRREAFYTHIPAGEYTFKVIAANSDGIWNESGITTSFVLMPFFYQSSWFIAMCIIGIVGIGPSIYLLRVRQLKRRELELTRIVEARTSDLKKEKENVERALSELKDAQHQLVQSEKMASLGQLTAGIAHEIKNPLNFVNNFSSLSNELMQELQEELNKKKEIFDETTQANIEDIINNLRQNVTKINEHGKRADSIVRGMLLHSRGKTGERQLTDINALLSEYTNLAYHGIRAQDSSFNVKIDTHFDETIGKVNIVPQDLSRVFLNIINNGCYSANDKKKNAVAGFSPVITVSSKNLGDKFEVRIRDNGSGIPQSVIDKIFNPFFTTKPAGAGTGLGLSLSYDIVTQEHKGEIRVDTKEGEFAEFIITIPKNAA